MYRLAALWLASFLLTAPGAAAQAVPEPTTRTAGVTRISEAIALDGVLDEAAWRSAPKIGELIQRQPNQGAAPTERTEVTLLHDESNLYIGVTAYDSEPLRVIGTQMVRDGSLNADDRIEILLDTFGDQRSAFYFATNPAGALVDGLTFANGQLNTDWDAIWNVRTRRNDQGWTAEFAIPFKSLTFPAERGEWGFNISRNILRKLEDARWSGARQDVQFLQVSEAGQITNLEGMTQGIGLDLRPFLAGRWLHQGGVDDPTGKPGLDLFYSITPSLKLTATLNTDFGETEVDARQINLSRFSLFFPEKRSFFLEDAGVFNFASLGPDPAPGVPVAGADVYPFFSRQIGLLQGREVPLDAGVKLTGKVGRTEVGVLDTRTRALDGVVDDKNFFVGRVKRAFFEQSYIGAVFTDGHPARLRDGQTYGADVRLTTSRFLGRARNFDTSAYAVRSVNRGVTDKDWSYGVSAQFPNDRFAGQLTLREIQENFAPALGFVQRSNVRMLRAAGSYNPRLRRFNLQQIFHDVYFTQFTRLDHGKVESRDLWVTFLDWHFRSGDSFHGVLDINPVYERVFEPFEISPGVVLQPAEYTFTRFKSNLFSTAAKRRLLGSLNVYWGNYWSGKAEQVTTALTYKLPPWFTLVLNTNQTWARLPEGNFTARIFTSNISYAASPRLSFSNLMQFDNRSRNLGWQSRIRYTLQPGRDLFFAFNQGWVEEQDEQSPGLVRTRRFRATESKVSAKLQYSVRL